MRCYLISFRILKDSNQLRSKIADALKISSKRMNNLAMSAVAQTDLKIRVTAEQLGNLQALRVKDKLADDIRYLHSVQEIEPTTEDDVVELRPNLRVIPNRF